jgi:adenosine deaminase
MGKTINFDIWAKGCVPIFGTSELTDFEGRLVSAIRAAPKVELHFHVEGAIRTVPLGRPHGCASNAQLSAEACFFQTWRDTIDSLRTKNDFIDAAKSVVAGFESCGVVWAEVFVSPPDCEMREKDPLSFAQALHWWLEAFNQVRSPKCEVRLIVDLVRIYSLSDAQRWFSELLEVRRSSGAERIIGVGLGGPQNSNPLRLYRDIFQQARREGLLCVAHAGEMGSGLDVAEAVFELGVSRIGHGLGLSASDDAYRYTLQNRIPVESCPTSSVKTGACSDLLRHPIRNWVQDGLPVTISTDDAALFRTELALEFLAVHRAFDWKAKTIAKIISDGFTVSTMPSGKAGHFIREVESTFATHRLI